MTPRRIATACAVLVVAALALGACGDDDDAGTATTTSTAGDASATTTMGATDGVVIVIDDVAFTTPDVTVEAGGTVTFDNQDNQAHTATADDGSFETDTIRSGEKKDVTFDEPGTYPYFCSFHPFMKGTVTVE